MEILVPVEYANIVDETSVTYEHVERLLVKLMVYCVWYTEVRVARKSQRCPGNKPGARVTTRAVPG